MGAKAETNRERISETFDKEKKKREKKHTESNHKLEDLNDSNVLFPPDFNTTCTLEIVPVHDDVNSQVERDWNP